MSGFEILLTGVDVIAQIHPHPLPEIAPTQLVDQFDAIVPATDAVKYPVTHLREGQHSVTDEGGQFGDSAPEVIPGLGVARGIDALQPLVCSVSTATDRAQCSSGLRELIAQQMIQCLAVWQISGQISRPLRP